MKLPGISQPNSAWSRRRFLCALSAAGVGQVLHSNLLRATGPPTTIFSDVTADAGITWRQFNGFSPDRYLIETMGGGVGMFDFDNDEKLDIFLLNGGETPRGKSAKPLQNALYRNLGNGKFAEVAAEAGLDGGAARAAIDDVAIKDALKRDVDAAIATGVFGSPSVYAANGEEFVAVSSGGGDRGRRGGDVILTFGLPPR